MKRLEHNYLAFGNRSAILLDEIDLTLHPNPRLNMEMLLRILTEKEGYHRVETNPVNEVLKCLGRPYKRRARLAEAPYYVNCSSLVAWAYGRCGIRLPRYAISQLYDGPGVNGAIGFKPGDLIFTDAERSYWLEDEDFAIGHVAMMVTEDSVVHAPRDQCVVRENFEDFMRDRTYRGTRRVIPEKSDLIVLEADDANEVDCSEMFLLRILSNL